MNIGSRWLLSIAALPALLCCLEGRIVSSSAHLDTNNIAKPATTKANESPTQSSDRIIHVLVALCDNEHQGIVPVPARLGNGEDLERNLYWGAAYGVKSFFAKSADWKLIAQTQNPGPSILQRCIFKNKSAEVYLIADAYRGAAIKNTIVDFFDYASGVKSATIEPPNGSKHPSLRGGGAADLIVFVGHNGLMDFNLQMYPAQLDARRRGAMILCCASKNYFAAPLRRAGADPILWTTGLMAPEAYVLKAALDGWIANESGERIRSRAAEAYNSYQHCGLKAARGLFSSGW